MKKARFSWYNLKIYENHAVGESIISSSTLLYGKAVSRPDKNVLFGLDKVLNSCIVIQDEKCFRFRVSRCSGLRTRFCFFPMPGREILCGETIGADRLNHRKMRPAAHYVQLFKELDDAGSERASDSQTTATFWINTFFIELL